MFKRLQLLLALALVAAACSGDAAEPATSTGASASTSSSTASTDAGDSSPASTTEPSSPDNETVPLVTGGERLDIVAQATEAWPTDWTSTSIDLSELILGIPTFDPRDAIPPIDSPQFESVTAAAEWLDPGEPGALVQLDGQARWYALSILHRHEIVNDEFGEVPVAVTYCPLCNTAIAFDRRLDGNVLRLGVSGLLRNSDMVMWDDQSVSLWQQITGEAIVGDATGSRLRPISTAIVSFGDFAESFPEGQSLSRNTGFGIDYGFNPYVGYSSTSQPFLFDGEPDPRFPALSRVVGVTIGDDAKAFPFSEIETTGVVNDEVGDEPIVVFWGGETRDALDNGSVALGQVIGSGIAYQSTVADQVLTFSRAGDLWTDAETGSTWTLLGEAIDGPLAGERLETAVHRNEFWFAWAAFFPDAAVYTAAG